MFQTACKWLLSIGLTLHLYAGEQLIILCDVDGVIRSSTDAAADPRIIQAFQSLLENDAVHVAFISGTPVQTDLSLEPSRRGNNPLSFVFNRYFDQELETGRVSIFGLLGAEKMLPNGVMQIEDDFSSAQTFELSRLLLHSFLKEVLYCGNARQQEAAKQLQESLGTSQIDFHDIVSKIGSELDPHFRLVHHRASVEIHASNPPWNISRSFPWLTQQLQNDPFFLATGESKRNAKDFSFLIVSKTHKGKTASRYIQEKLQMLPNALIISIGDARLDFPMHRQADLAFHVGAEQIWREEKLPQCLLVRDENGKDRQYVEGTLKVLQTLQEALERDVPFKLLANEKWGSSLFCAL